MTLPNAIRIAAGIACLLGATEAVAATTTYDLVWTSSGDGGPIIDGPLPDEPRLRESDTDGVTAGDISSNESGASATGSITLDDILFDESRSFFGASATDFPGAGITAFDITVSGASAGNGSFDLTDVTGFVFTSGNALDDSTELVGQAGFADFNFFTGIGSGAPSGFEVFSIATSGSGETLRLTSFAPVAAVPVPATALLLLSGLGCAAAVRRRKPSA